MGLFTLLIICALLQPGLNHLNHDEHDFRHISYLDLQLDSFQADGVTTYSQLLFDVSRNQVLVGARDALFRLSLPDLRLLETATWPAPAAKTNMCLTKGQSEENCRNYVKVLLTDGRRVFACGTQSFAPTCTWREIESLNTITETIDGIARCPYNPTSNTTALLTQDGDYFMGGPTDFSGSDFAIYKDSRLRTRQYDSMWLNEPQFVGSFESDQFVYFVFREAAVEYINCGKIVYSRIARVCKKDTGGQLMLKDNWTTFAKARLNCSVAGQYPFYYDEIQDFAYVAEEHVLYATFTTGPNSIAGSAVCAFNMSAIDGAFAGPFKTQKQAGSAWNQEYPEHPERLQCSGVRNPIEGSKYQLMDFAVQATTLKPLYELSLERFTHITVDALKLGEMHVIYVATQAGQIRKLSVIPGSAQTCLIEVWNPVGDHRGGGGGVNTILNLEYLKANNSVYLGTRDAVLRMPAHHCERHRSSVSCLNAMDPYCGWNEMKDSCTSSPNGDAPKYWRQARHTCPVLDAPVDGGWSSWGEWHSCTHSSSSSDDSDECLCRRRSCNNPAPQNGGYHCQGNSISVTNCTVHGDWTVWSAFSECSATCGYAVKTRTRTCTNPAPAFGGRVCVGHERSEVLCTGIPPCPVPAPTPQDGGWGAWEPWSACSQPCGGYRTRIRHCNDPPPLSGGLECTGSAVEYEPCRKECGEQRKSAIIAFNYTSADGVMVTRKFKYTCRAQVAATSMIHVTHKEIACRGRHCDEEGGVWSGWSEWTRCSVTCGIGHETRERRCEGGRDCKGQAVQTRECMVDCKSSTWGCWSDWSPCSVSCGWGIRKRFRECLGVNCAGEHMQEEMCEAPTCGSLLGWGEWTVWSECDLNDEQHRKRSCRSTVPNPQICQGPSKETRMCVIGKEWNVRTGESTIAQATALLPLVAYIVIAIIFGFVTGVGMMYFYARRKRKRRERVPSSPHYMSTKQNPYITVPFHDSRHRRHNHATASGLNNQTHNGTLKSNKLYDTLNTTLKRHSKENNCKEHVDVFHDKLYE